MVAPNGKYYSEKAPFLSIVTAVCVGTRSERARFSVGHSYREFCFDGYGLTPEQTATLTAAAYNRPADDFSCVPDQAQLDAIITELTAELAKPESARVRADLRNLPPARPSPGLDPDLKKMFHTLEDLYSHYILGKGSAPTDWQARLKAEFWPELPWIW